MRFVRLWVGLCLSCLLVGCVLPVFPVSKLTKDRRWGVGALFPGLPAPAVRLDHRRS